MYLNCHQLHDNRWGIVFYTWTKRSYPHSEYSQTTTMIFFPLQYKISFCSKIRFHNWIFLVAKKRHFLNLNFVERFTFPDHKIFWFNEYRVNFKEAQHFAGTTLPPQIVTALSQFRIWFNRSLLNVLQYYGTVEVKPGIF